MRPEQKLKFLNERGLIIETLRRQIKNALIPFHDGQIKILSTTVQRTDNPEEIRVTTRFSVSRGTHVGKKDGGQIYIDNRTPKVGEVFVSGQRLTTEYFAVLARIADSN